jgi:hypothetical protein
MAKINSSIQHLWIATNNKLTTWFTVCRKNDDDIINHGNDHSDSITAILFCWKQQSKWLGLCFTLELKAWWEEPRLNLIKYDKSWFLTWTMLHIGVKSSMRRAKVKINQIEQTMISQWWLGVSFALQLKAQCREPRFVGRTAAQYGAGIIWN